MSHPFDNKSNALNKWGSSTRQTNSADWTDAVIISSLNLVNSLRDERVNRVPTRSVSLREPKNNRRSPRSRQVPRDDALSTAESLETWLKCGLAIGAGALAVTAIISKALEEDNQNNQNNESD